MRIFLRYGKGVWPFRRAVENRRGEKRANPAEDRARFSFYSLHDHLESEDSTFRIR